MSTDALPCPDAASSPGAARSWPWASAREVGRLAGPAALHALIVTLGFVADRVWIARFASSALASMQISTTLSWTVHAVLAALATAALALVGRLRGRADHDGARAAGGAALALTALLAVCVVVPLTAAAGEVIDALFPGVSSEVRRDALAYLTILLPALPLALLSATAMACLHALGDTRTPLRAAALACALDLVLSPLGVLGLGPIPALGPRGAALGSVTSFAVELAILGLALVRARAVALPRPAELGSLVLRLLSVGLPALCDRAAQHAGYLGYAALVALLGAHAMAANQALLGLEALAFPIAEGLAVAAASLVARQLGAGRGRAATWSWLAAASMAAAAMSLVSVGWLALSKVLLPAFGVAGGVAASAERALWLAAIAQPLMAVAVVGGAALRAAGATRATLWITLVCAVPLRLASSWLFAVELDMGLAGIWLGSAIDWLAQAALVTWRLSAGAWRRAVV